MASPQVEASEPDRKRPRVDEPTDLHVPPNFINHPTLYFGDGNVILRCGKTYFRVHRTLLTRNSPVFRDILATSDRVGGDQFRGCVLLTLDDDADDMELLLNRVYDGFDMNFSEFTASTFPALASILRLVMKYQIERPQKVIFELLRREWPSTLEKYDIKVNIERAAIAAEGDSPEEYTIMHPTTVIALLRECGYVSADLLAPLFYDLSNQVWQFTKPISPYHLEGLSLSDVQRFVVGLNKLRALHVREARCPMGVVPNNHPACQSALAVGWRGEVYDILHYQGNDMCYPLESWLVLISRAKLPSQPGAPVPRVVPNDNPMPAAPPAYNPLPAGGGGQQWHGNLAVAGVPRHALQGIYNQNLFAGYNAQLQAFDGVARVQPAPQQAAPPAPVPMPYQQPQPAPQAQPSQEQAQAPQPLFDKLCASCRQSVVRSMEASRQKIWDSLPEIFNLV